MSELKHALGAFVVVFVVLVAAVMSSQGTNVFRPGMLFVLAAIAAVASLADVFIRRAVQTVTTANEGTDIITKGRHDPCVGIRAAPVGEAMMALVLADHALRHRGQTGRDGAVGFERN